MKKLIPLLMLVVFVVASCAPHIHIVGEGALGMQTETKRQWWQEQTETKRQWYILDLVPINEVDTNAMAGGAADYTIKTEANFVDVLIAVFVPVITARTVTVTK